MICDDCESVPIDEWVIHVDSDSQNLSISVLRSTLAALKSSISVSYESLSNEELVTLTSLKRSQIDELADLGSISRLSVFHFFLYVRLGIGQRSLAAIVGTQQSAISDSFLEVIQKLEKPLAEKYLRFSRDKIIEEHTPDLYHKILPKALLGTDGEYWRINQPADFVAQKRVYCKHKHAHLASAMSLMCLDGMTWDVLGVFASDGSHNDEMKWEYIWEKDIGSFKEMLLDDDEFVVDRYQNIFFKK